MLRFQFKIRCIIDDSWKVFVLSVNLFCRCAIMSTSNKYYQSGPEMHNYMQHKDSLESNSVVDVRSSCGLSFFNREKSNH